MYNRNIIMNDSTRLKLYVTKKRLDNNSNCSDAYVRLFNASLRRNYCLWLTVSRSIRNLFNKIIDSDNKIICKCLNVVQYIGRFFIRICDKFK